MRRSHHRNPLAIVAMVALLLLGTSGLTISRMTCLLGGHTVVSLGLMEDCCPEEEEHAAPVVKALCCDFGTASSTIEDLLPNPHQESPSVCEGMHPMRLAFAFTDGAEPIAWLATRPPPRSVAERLSGLRSLRI